MSEITTGEINETGISWDHDTGDIIIDTRRKAIENKLRKFGFKPIRSEVNGYTSFSVNEKDLIVSFRKRKRLSEEERERRSQRMREMHSGREN